jgi:hypothetical protein
MLPAQFFALADSAGQVRGEVALVYAVLEDALRCFQRGVTADRQRAQRLTRAAEEGFFADDYRATGDMFKPSASLDRLLPLPIASKSDIQQA